MNIEKFNNFIKERQREKEILRKIRREEIVTEEEFYNMLQLSFPCDRVVRLHHPMKGEAEYFLMSKTPRQIAKYFKDDERFYCDFKQLTGQKAGEVYKNRRFNISIQDGIYLYPNRRDKSKLTLSINLYSWPDIEECTSELETRFGKTISFAQLLMLWKTERGQMMNIDILNYEDYMMVTKVYNSEDILNNSNNQTFIK